jgi:hypothetical protein
VKGRHRILVIRQTRATPHRIDRARGAHRIDRARGAHTMPTGLRDRAEIECFLASEGIRHGPNSRSALSSGAGSSAAISSSW